VVRSISDASNLPAGEIVLTQIPNAGAYNVSIKLARVGDYTITISLNGERIGTNYKADGEIYFVSVGAGSVSAKFSAVSGRGLLGSLAGLPTTFTLVTQDPGLNLVTGPQLTSDRCTAELVAVDLPASSAVFPLNVEVTDASAGRYTGGYMMTRAGVYILNVYFDMSLAGLSPYELSIVARESSPATTTIRDAPLGSVTGGERHVFTVVVRDIYGNQRPVGGESVQVRLETAPGSNVSALLLADVVDNQDGTYAATYLPITAGPYLALVALNGHDLDVGGYPLTVLQSPTDATFTFARGPGLTNALAGDVAEFSIVPMDQGGLRQIPTVQDDFTVVVSPTGSGFGQVMDVLKKSDGTYTVGYRAERVLFFSGGSLRPYRIDVTLGSSPIKGSPFFAQMAPGPASAATSIMFTNVGEPVLDGRLLTREAGVLTELLIQTRDAFGNDALYSNFAAVVDLEVYIEGTATRSVAGLGSAEGVRLNAEVIDLRDGRYRAFYIPTIAGEYDLFVVVNQAVILEDTRKLFTISPSVNDPTQFLLKGPGITDSVQIFETTFFNLQTRDRFGNYRIDDGSLANQFGGGAYVQVVMTVTTGSVLTNNMAVYAVDNNDVIWVQTSPDNRTITDGSYIVRFTVQRPGKLETSVNYVAANQDVTRLETILNLDLPWTKTILQASAVGGRTYGPAFDPNGAGLGTTVPLSTDDLFLYIQPLDVRGNAVSRMPEGVNQNGDFTVEVFPSTSTSVTQPSVQADGTWVADFKAFQVSPRILPLPLACLPSSAAFLLLPPSFPLVLSSPFS
jgi:hypothetical protein